MTSQLSAHDLLAAAGMNFVGEDESGDQMKELHWEYGYMMFWILGSVVTLLILFMLWKKVSLVVLRIRALHYCIVRSRH